MGIEFRKTTVKALRVRFKCFVLQMIDPGSFWVGSRTDPESYITEYTLVYEDQTLLHRARAQKGQTGVISRADSPRIKFTLNPELPVIAIWRGVQVDNVVFFFALATGPRRPLGLKLSDARVFAPQF